MRDPLPWLQRELDQLREQGLVRRRRCVRSLGDGWCEVDGKKLRDFASNDYLNLAHDVRVLEAARSALEQTGAGARASALVTGRGPWHERLEQTLAEFEGQPAAVLFPTGFAANVGTISALVGRNDEIFSDRLNHASLIDGCRLSRARLHIYRHDDLDALEAEMQKLTGDGRRLIVTDGLFSMDGDAAPLPELCDLAERYEAALLVDEAHGTGVFGEHGRGLAEHFGVEDRVAVRVGTLSKAVGALGGFVTGSQTLIDWLWNRARTKIFSTALPPTVCAAATAAVDIIRNEPERRKLLQQQATRLRKMLAEAGFQVPPQVVGPIIPLILTHPEAAMRVAGQLEERGYLVAGIRPPTVPAGTSRLRITVCTAHTDEDLAGLVAALKSAWGHARG